MPMLLIEEKTANSIWMNTCQLPHIWGIFTHFWPYKWVCHSFTHCHTFCRFATHFWKTATHFNDCEKFWLASLSLPKTLSFHFWILFFPGAHIATHDPCQIGSLSPIRHITPKTKNQKFKFVRLNQTKTLYRAFQGFWVQICSLCCTLTTPSLCLAWLMSKVS